MLQLTIKVFDQATPIPQTRVRKISIKQFMPMWWSNSWENEHEHSRHLKKACNFGI
uniref:Uncharacterized protein n=1 Tax=Rhizophora mucronata TaxID=61149 RepID=A0A2P2KB81_RHIMU